MCAPGRRLPPEYEERLQRLQQSGDRSGYTALVVAAFCEAVERRFAPDSSVEDVVEFVGDVRTRSAQAAEQLDPRVAERMVLTVYTDESVDDVDRKTVSETQFLLLGALVADAKFSDAELDSFLADARRLADEWVD